MADQEYVNEQVDRLRGMAMDLLIFADWLKAHGAELDEIPYVSDYQRFHIYPNKRDDEGNLDVVATQVAISKVAKTFGKATKDFRYDSLEVAKDFGNNLKLIASVEREAVCTKTVKSREYVKHTSDGYWKEDVEWDCHTPSILALDDKE